MNLIITDQCNRACPYCFGGQKVKLSLAGNLKVLAYPEFEFCLDFLERSRRPDLKLLGGEPTLHPEFERMVQAGLQRNLRVIVFSNGLWSERVTRFVRENTNPRFTFLFNVNEPAMQTPLENERQAETLAIAGKRGGLGFNIYRPDFDLRFTTGLIRRYGLKSEVRLGIAHPIAGQTNACVPDADLKAVGERLLRQMDELEQQGVLVALDCGFPLCMFPEAKLGQLVTGTRPGPYSTCGPIIDVGPGLTAWPCFPLGELLNVNLRDFEHADALVAYYDRRLATIRDQGFLSECRTCRFRLRSQCACGCLARTLQNWTRHGDTTLLRKLQ
jgi:MoaA/NifB/PqqE/SkfB family radical SAM enzyme